MVDTRITTVQTRLNELYGSLLCDLPLFDGNSINVDGSFGPKTKAALTVWLQLELCELGYGLELDGVLGDKTLDALNKSGVSVDGSSTGNLVLLVKYILTCEGYCPDTVGRLIQGNPRLSGAWIPLLVQYKKDTDLENTPVADAEFFKKALS